MHRSAIALLLSAALSNADFLTPNRGETLAVNEAFAIQWDTDGLVEPLSIDLVPGGPEDDNVAQQVGVDIANSGELEFTPDATIANSDAFQFVLTDAEGNSINSEPFSIDGLSNATEEDATEEDAEEEQTDEAAEDEAAATSDDEPVAVLAGEETVNGPLEVSPLSDETDGVSAQSEETETQGTENETETETETEEDAATADIDVAGGVAQEGAVEFSTEIPFNAEAQALQGDVIAAGAAIPQALSPGDPGFIDIGDRGLGVAANLGVPAGQAPAVTNVADVAVETAVADVTVETINAGQAAVDTALQFSPIATTAAAIVDANTLVGAVPEAAPATIGLGEVAVEDPLSLAPIETVAATAAGGFSVINAAPTAVATPEAVVGGGFTNTTGTIANTTNLETGNLNAGAGVAGDVGVGGGVSNDGAVTFDPLSTDIALNTNLVAPTLGVPSGGDLVPDITAPGAPLDPNNPLETGIPLGGGDNPNSPDLLDPNNPGSLDPNNPDSLDPNNPNPTLVLPDGDIGATGTGVVPPINTNILGGNGPNTLSTGGLVVDTTLATSILGTGTASTGLLAPTGADVLAPQNSGEPVEVTGAAAGKVSGRNAVLGGVVALFAAMMM